MARWVVSSAAELAVPLERYARACDEAASVTHIGDGPELRRRLRADLAGAFVLVGDGAGGPAGLDAVNLAAAVAADGRAAEVVLVTCRGSGSLRSRAKRAGIGSVMDVGELAMALREAEVAERGGYAEADSVTGHAGVGVAGSDAGSGMGAVNQTRCSDGGAGYAEGAPVQARRANGAPDSPQGEPSYAGAASDAVPGSEAGAAPGAAGARGSVKLAQLMEAAREMSGRRPPELPQAAAQRKPGVPVITFVSGRGGVGKSTLVACAAHMAAAWGMDVACLDLDLSFGNLFSLCGVPRQTDLAQAAEGELSDEALESLGVEASEHVHVWGPCRNPEYAEVVHPVVADIIARLTHKHDLVLIDTSASWGDATACAAQMADRLVIVSDERPGAIPALSRCGSLAVRLGIARTRIVRLMNGCDPRMRDATFVARAAVGLECAREIRVPDGGLEVVELMSTGKASELMALDNPMPAAVAHGLAQLLKELGVLPECEGAAKALEGRQRSKKLFSRMREAS